MSPMSKILAGLAVLATLVVLSPPRPERRVFAPLRGWTTAAPAAKNVATPGVIMHQVLIGGGVGARGLIMAIRIPTRAFITGRRRGSGPGGERLIAKAKGPPR